MKLSDRQLMARYRASHGVKYVEARDQVKSQVPETILLNDLRYNHFPSYYKANERRYAYYNVSKDEFVFLTADEVKALPIPNPVNK